jgi:1-acyl-sn-glycerol-3-phosphate acyltransferase
MINSDGIEKFSWPYYALKTYVDFCFRYFYKVSIRGIENVDLEKINIYAPNHQNALMDALALLSIYNFQPVFLARSDIFKNKRINSILTFLKILPVYRMRDGYGELQKNDATFSKTIEILENKRGIGIFPEGSHGLKKQIRNLKKGIARISLLALENSNGKMEINIVPIGIYYQDHHKKRSHLFIEIGKPFSISGFYEQYLSNPAIAHNQLLDELRRRMKSVMLHVENEDAYDTIEFLIDIYDSIGRALNESGETIFDTHKSLITTCENLHEKAPGKFDALEKKCIHFKAYLSDYKIPTEAIGLAMNKLNIVAIAIKSILVLAGIPLFIYSFLQNLLPSLLTSRLRKVPKEPQFISSMNFVGGIVFYPVFYILQVIVVLLLSGSWQWALIYLFSLPFTFLFRDLWARYFAKLKMAIKIFNKRNEIKGLIENIYQITGLRFQNGS